MTPLRRELIRKLELHRMSASTRKLYVRAVEGLAEHYGRSPDRIDAKGIQDYLHHQLVVKKLSWSTCNVTAAGLAFFYTRVLDRPGFRAELPPRRRPRRLPEVLSRDEVLALFDAAWTPMHRAVLMTTYGGGLRSCEVVRLKVTDVDSRRMTIRVEQGKGRKDRHAVLGPRLLGELRVYWRVERPPLWLFPKPESQREHWSAEGAQKMYYRTKKRAGIKRSGGIHALRHSFATHMLEDGVDSTVIQSMMGHAHISTTAQYLHVSRRHLAAVKSPLDTLLPDKSTAL